MTRTRRTLIAIALTASIAACGKSNGVETEPTPFTAPAAAPLCSDAFHDGQPVTLLDNTTPDPNYLQPGGAYGNAYDKCHGNTPS